MASPVSARRADIAQAIAKHAGARYVVTTDVNPYRLDLAKKMGATVALNVRERRIAAPEQATSDLAFEAGPSQEAF